MSGGFGPFISSWLLLGRNVADLLQVLMSPDQAWEWVIWLDPPFPLSFSLICLTTPCTLSSLITDLEYTLAYYVVFALI